VTTIGVSVAVPDPWGSELQTYRVKLGDEEAAGIPSHITLLPPIDVDDALIPEIQEHLEHMAGASASFDVHLRGTGTFRPVSPVVFVNVVRGISGFELLALAVRQGPLAIEAHFPYHPHVTVAHDLDEDSLDQAFEDLEGFECRFTVEHFSLYVHSEDDGWTPVRHFSLSRGQSAPGS
jgi:2'-5' RNA ligase